MTGVGVALGVLLYLAGWLVCTVSLARWLAQNQPRCHALGRDGGPDQYTWGKRSDCRGYHHPDCWHPTGTVHTFQVSEASALALLWPMVGPFALAYWLATRTPTPVGLQQRIAELERETGTGPWA